MARIAKFKALIDLPSRIKTEEEQVEMQRDDGEERESDKLTQVGFAGDIPEYWLVYEREHVYPYTFEGVIEMCEQLEKHWLERFGKKLASKWFRVEEKAAAAEEGEEEEQDRGVVEQELKQRFQYQLNPSQVKNIRFIEELVLNQGIPMEQVQEVLGKMKQKRFLVFRWIARYLIRKWGRAVTPLEKKAFKRLKKSGATASIPGAQLDKLV